MFDIAIVGGGIVGCACFSKLARLDKKVVLLEKENDVGFGASKANSALIHSGFDAVPGTLKAKLNVRGNKMFDMIAKKLQVPFKRVGHLVVGNDIDKLQELKSRGEQNGIFDLKIIGKAELQKLEPNIKKGLDYALFAPSGGICSSYDLPVAFAEDGAVNGGKVEFLFETMTVEKKNSYFEITSKDNRKIQTKYIINCAGAGFNAVSKIIGAEKYKHVFKRGEYFLLDTASANFVNHTVFPLPQKGTKGVLVTTSVHGNVLVGPTSYESSTEPLTTKMGLDEIREKSKMLFENVPFNKNIRVFAGVRSIVGEDFVIEKSKKVDNVINVAGICSPGLSAAPAIAEYVATLLGLDPQKENPNAKQRTPIERLVDYSAEELDKKIKNNPDLGKIVCRCENISLHEIKQALSSPVPANSVDGIKRRTRAGMGRCQSGFCMLKVMEEIAKSKKTKIDGVLKESKGSEIIVSDISRGTL